MRIAINGMGRIGRSLFRVLTGNPSCELVAVNDLADARILSHLIKYDTVHGKFSRELECGDGFLVVDGKKIQTLSEPEPKNLPWGTLGVDLVVECTGRFNSLGARDHLLAGAKRVVVSAPSDLADLTVVFGINHDLYDPSKHFVVSNASCTTNCLAPLLKVLDDNFGVAKGLVTTIHSYTGDQRLLDNCHKDLRRARTAGTSIVPTTTGAAKAVELILPSLAGKLDGVSVRVPVPDVSLADLTVHLERNTDAAEVNRAFKAASAGALSGVLGYTEEPLVSADYVGCAFSAVVDGPQTKAVGGDMVKVSAWYDNEWGYANRLADVINYIKLR